MDNIPFVLQEKEGHIHYYLWTKWLLGTTIATQERPMTDFQSSETIPTHND